MKANDFTKEVLPLKNNLYRVAYRITQDTDQSAQIVQEVMMKIWAERVHLQVIDNLPAYCLMVTRNLSLQKVTSEKQHFLVG